jgi:hypothetical protein
MENSPITLLHWHTEPALIGGILFVGWAYSLFMGPYAKNLPGFTKLAQTFSLVFNRVGYLLPRSWISLRSAG